MPQVKRILVARIGRIGDMVMITPAMQALLVKFPHANITLLTTSDGVRTFKGFSDRIDKFILYDRKSLVPWLTRINIKKSLNEDQYDHIYCFESNPNFLKLFSQLNSSIHSLQSTSDKSIHYAQYCLNLVNPDDVNTKMAFPLKLVVTEKAKLDAKRQLETLQITASDFVIGFHPSFSGLAKSFGRAKKSSQHRVWLIENWGILATLITNYASEHHLNIKIMMDLIPEEQAIGETIQQQSQGAALYQCPPLNFERYKATLARYDLLITPNSGPMHIAAAVNTKVITLFSKHTPSDCQPFVPDDQFTVLQAEAMPHPEKGLAAIDPQTVFKSCLEYLPTKKTI
ncbi:MAG: glycosyltransferase family 9 protein [Gammaproteobacteria bacterium]